MAPLWAGTEVAALEGLEAYLAVAAAIWRLGEAQSSLSLIAGAPAVALQVQSVAFTSPLRVPSSRCHHVAGLCVLRLGLRGCWYTPLELYPPQCQAYLLRYSPWVRSSPGGWGLSSLVPRPALEGASPGQ